VSSLADSVRDQICARLIIAERARERSSMRMSKDLPSSSSSRSVSPTQTGARSDGFETDQLGAELPELRPGARVVSLIVSAGFMLSVIVPPGHARELRG
jgi:hypothetical protein